MKSLNEQINESLITEANVPNMKYYKNTLNTLSTLIESMPLHNYNTHAMESMIKDFFIELRLDNETINEDSMNGKCDPDAEIIKLKSKVGAVIIEALAKSCSNAM